MREPEFHAACFTHESPSIDPRLLVTCDEKMLNLK